ncbi:ead/Ea22-like family protein [Klebsiella pneumoniae]|nr:ead/Ea22-like family protein [Klebsiella pneumoniae]
MTDITELAQSLKAAADREMICRDVAETSEIWERTVTPENILALVEALEKSEKTSEARREAIGITHKRAARERDRANAAEEALEKAQAQSSKWLEAYHKAVSIGARYEERIAELESRTVKLPDLRQIVSGDRYVWSDGVYNYSQDVKVVLADAGIKVEAE